MDGLLWSGLGRSAASRPSSREISACSERSCTSSRTTSVWVRLVIRISSLRISLVLTTSCSSTTGMISTPSSSCATGTASIGTPSGTRSTVTSPCRSAISTTSSRSSTRVRTMIRPRSTSRLVISTCSSASSMGPGRVSVVINADRSRWVLSSKPDYSAGTAWRWSSSDRQVRLWWRGRGPEPQRSRHPRARHGDVGSWSSAFAPPRTRP